uniref:Vitronectin a n=1 Tax=Paramormyrops kingsleyae TaxID=1676925 RepID=A0A3B3SH50_9TELE
DMRLAILIFRSSAFWATDSCLDRCENGYDLITGCQCDSMCAYYESCCSDYESVCRDRSEVRGDTFPDLKTSKPSFPAEVTVTITTSTTDHMELTVNTTESPDPDADACSGRAFDSFMQLKNDSTYAFRGSFFFELGEKAVLPGYPKRIEDVWGIFGPIDAAFTRINCQGLLSYEIPQGNMYWRFEDNVLDEEYPRNISDGFENIPDNVDAAFAVPAKNHHGKEKVYFFKGDQYYQYEFKQQPTHEECVKLNARSPSTLFGSYTAMFSSTWGGQGLGSAPPLITRDWLGVQAPVDAVSAGRLYVSRGHRGKSRRRQNTNRKQDWDRGQRSWQKRSPQWSMDKWDVSMGQGFMERFYREETRRQDWDRGRALDWAHHRCISGHHRQQEHYNSRYSINNRLVQKVYFFKKDRYYRVDLQSMMVDLAYPPYPRSTAKYWLGTKGGEKVKTDFIQISERKHTV